MKIKSLEENEKDHLLAVLDKTHWDMSKTARLLQIPLDVLKSKIKSFGLVRQDTGGPDSQET